MNTYYKLETGKAGYYESNNLINLFLQVIRHRFWHLFKGDGWVD